MFYDLCSLLFLSSCSPSFHVPDLTEEERRLLPDFSTLSAEEVLPTFHQYASRLRDLQGRILAYMETPERSGAFDGAVVIRWPDAFRLKAFRGSSATFLDLLLDSAGVRLFLPGENKIYTALPEDSVPLGEGGTAFSTRNFLDLLTLQTDSRGPESIVAPDGERWTLSTPERTYELDRRTLFLLRTSFRDDAEGAILEARYDAYRLSDGIWFPRLIEIEDRTGSFFLKMLLRDPALNQGLVPEAFDWSPPEDAEAVRRSE